MKNPSSQVFDKNRLMVSFQKKHFSEESERSSWDSKSFSKYFWHMLWILFRFSNIRAIEWWQFQNDYRHRLDFMTGNWPCYRFLQIKAWNACRIFYSFGLTRPLRVSKIFLKAQIKNLLPQSSQECSGESKTYIHHGHISWNEEMHQKKTEKKSKTASLSALLK